MTVPPPNPDERSGEPAADAPKPRRRRKAARPQEIIEAGLLEFGEKGFAATKLEDVAARAGIVKGTIYRYFPGKEDLFMAAVMSRADSILAAAAAGADATPRDASAQIALLIRRFYAVAFGSDLEVLLRIIMTEGRHFPVLARIYHGQMITVGRGLLDRIVQQGIERGEFRDGPASRQPMLIMAPLLMATVWRMTFDSIDPLDLDAFAQSHVDLVLNGLSA